MIVRPYELGDEDGIEFTDIASREWGDDDDRTALYYIHRAYSVTVVDGEYKNIGCFIPCKDGSEYVFFLLDRRSNPLIIRHCREILQSRPNKVWSLAQAGQDKMHKFLGMVKTGLIGDKERWEKLERL